MALLALQNGTAGTAAAMAQQALQMALWALLQPWHDGTAGTARWHSGHYGTAGTAKWHCGHCCCYGTVAQQALQMALRALLLLWHCGVAQWAQQSWHCSPTELALWHGTLALLEGLRGVRGRSKPTI